MRKFLTDSKKALIVLCALIVAIFIFMILANGIQTAWGKIKVQTETLTVNDPVSETNEEISLAYKIYVPKNASKESKAPAALLLHGYQNDKETCDAYAIELARRGFVVLSIDEYGHGSTDIGFLKRGYVNHKVKVNYGNDSEEDGTYASVSGSKRYRILMNFSNLSFFLDKYSKDAEGNEIYDSSMGGIAAYYYLSQLDYVDNSKMIVSGHSMGTWASWTVAAFYSKNDIAPKAVVLQCGELFRMNSVADSEGVAPYDTNEIKFGNILLLQAKWDEFNYFRDYKNKVSDELLDTAIRYEFLGTTKGNAEWNKVYGSFEDGTAREIVLLYTNHRLTTHNRKGLAYVFDFISKSTGVDMGLKNTNTIFSWKELFVLLATFSGLLSLLAVLMILKNVPFFKEVFVPFEDERQVKVKEGWSWWKGTILTMAISAFTYPFLTQLGHALFPLPEKVFRMSVGNGFLVWYLFLIVVMLCLTIIPRLIGKKKGKELPDYVDMGLSRIEHKDSLDWLLFGKSLLVASIMILVMYLEVTLTTVIFQLDFRYIWPFFRMFTWTRFGQFLVYLPVFMLFFILNNSKIFASQRAKDAITPGFKGFINTWWRGAIQMVGGILFIILLEYIPFFLNIGPGADLLFSSTFGGPFMSLLIVFAPQVIVFSLICTFCYRKTGNIYIGAMTVSMLACWVVTGGSAMV